MAATKLWSVTTNLKRVQDYALDEDKTEDRDLASVLNYAVNGEKTEHKYYTLGINCTPDNAYNEFMQIKERYQKTDGVLAYHGYMSFAHGEITPDEALQIGKEFAERMWGNRYQVIISEHLNTECLHCHFVVNSVSIADGTKLKDNEKNWNYFKRVADEICRAHNKSVIYGDLPKQPTKRDIFVKSVIDDGLVQNSDILQLESWLTKRGFVCDFNENHKYWTVIPKGWTRPYRLNHLNKVFQTDEYSVSGIYAGLKLKSPQLESSRFHTGSKISDTNTKNYSRSLQPKINNYPNRQARYKSVFGTLLDLLMLLSDTLRIIAAPSPYFQLTKGLTLYYSKPYFTYGSYKVHYPVNVSGKNLDLIEKASEKLFFLEEHQINSLEDLKSLKASNAAYLKDLYAKKNLLDTRSAYEDVSSDLASLNKELEKAKLEKSYILYYLKEDIER